MDEVESNNIEKELDGLLIELQKNPENLSKSLSTSKNQIKPAVIEDLSSEERLLKFIDKNIQEVLSTTLDTLKNFAKDVGDDAEKASALASLLSSNGKIIEILNKRLLKEKDIKAKKELQQEKLNEAKIKETLEKGKSFVSGREELMDYLIDKVKRDSIDAEFDDNPTND